MIDSTTTAKPVALEAPWPEPRKAWYAVWIVTIALVFSFLDRQILTLLVEPIKRDLVISDTQMSLLLGFAFALFYVVVGLPIGRLADAKSRRVIIGTGVAIWSVMTGLCGIAQNYAQLFTARVGIGVGEAALSPATFSMLSDFFPREKLAKATSAFNIGGTVGSGIALIVGGTVVKLVAEMPKVALPMIGDIYPWQLTFFIVGLPGLIIAALMATVQEPPRRGLIERSGGGPQARKSNTLPIKQVVRYLLDDWRTYGPIFIGLGVKSLQAFGTAMWIPTFFIRSYGWSAIQIGLAYGTIIIIVSPIGMISGGMLAGWFARRGYDDANIRVVTLAATLVVPFSVLYPLMPSPYLALALLACNMFSASLGPGPGTAALQMITPNQMRAQVMAAYYLVLNLVGFGLGPTMVAIFTDYVFHSEAYLNYSLALTSGTLGPIGAVIIWYGLKPYGRSVRRARAWADTMVAS